MTPHEAQELLERASGHHLQGRLAEAQGHYRQFLDHVPGHPGALHMLGACSLQLGDAAAAADLIARSLAADPGKAAAHSNLCAALARLGRHAEALASVERAIALQAGLVDAHFNRGNVLCALQRWDDAVGSYARALELAPRHVGAALNRGNTLRRLGRLDAALASYEHALRCAPANAEAHNNRGTALLDLMRPDAALASFDAALAIDPGYAAALNNRGAAQLALGDAAAALASHDAALAIQPGLADALSNRGNALQQLGRLGEALDSYAQALALAAGDARILNNQAKVLLGLGRAEEALHVLDRALAAAPLLANAHDNRGNALKQLGRLDGALASYERALAIDPDFVPALGNRAIVLMNLKRHDEALASYRRATALDPGNAHIASNALFAAQHAGNADGAELLQRHRAFGARFEAPLRAGWQRHANARVPQRKLRVGFVSGDLRDHPVGYFIAPVWRALDRRQLEIIAYHSGPLEDSWSQVLRDASDGWVNAAALSDDALAARIRDDGIDILVDLSGHTAHQRLLAFARKPAPLQASWIGYPATTGLHGIDYYFVNRHCAPPGMLDAQFVEKLVRLPAPAPFMPPPDSPQPGPLPALRQGCVTFGSFNRIDKAGDAALALWAEVLAAVPGSRLVIGNSSNAALRATLARHFAQLGVAPERLQFLPPVPLADYLRLHDRIDIILDTFPYTGGTTTRFALWMGVPVLTLAGPSLPQRQGAGIVRAAGLDEWAVDTPAAYVAQACRAAADLPALAALRAGMRARIEQGPLIDPSIISRGLESALRTMWIRWCAGLPPEPFDA